MRSASLVVFRSVLRSTRPSSAFCACGRIRFFQTRCMLLTSNADDASPKDVPPSQPPPSHWAREPVGFALTGFLAASLGGLLGIGGGVLVIPIMVSQLKIPQHVAHGTSLVAVTGTGIVGAYKYFAASCVDVNAAILLTLVAMPMAIVGVNYASSMHPATLKRYFGYWLMFAAVLIPIKVMLPTLLASGAVLATAHSPAYYMTVGGIGTASGFLSGLMGVGGGIAMVPVLALAGMPQHLAQGTALAGMVIPSVVGTLSHHKKGNVKVSAIPWLLTGTGLGAWGGSKLALMMPEWSLQLTFAAALFAIGIQYNRK